MHAWEAIQNTLNIIEENLSEEITIETLASHAALSPYYFQRLFKRLVNKPVNEYIKLRRLDKASQALASSDQRILDIALKYGFSNHANFTRAFTEAYGISPEEYRKGPIILNQYVKPGLVFEHTLLNQDEPLIADGIVLEVTRKTLDKPRTFLGFAHEVPVTELSQGQNTGVAMLGELWQIFHQQKANIPCLLPGGNELGVVYSENAPQGCCMYMTGAEVISNANAGGYASFILPCGDYIICTVEAENFDELIVSAIFKATAFMRGWMKQHHLTCGSFAAEMYFDAGPADASHMELWLPVKPGPSLKRPEAENQWDKNNGFQKPTLETIASYVNSPLWEEICDYLETQFHSAPLLEFSKCSYQHGWNIKYKKGGRTLCTLYPMSGYFITLIVIGQREQREFEKNLSSFSATVQQLYHETKSGMGQRWLMIPVENAEVLEDVKQCIAIRRGTKNQIVETI